MKAEKNYIDILISSTKNKLSLLENLEELIFNQEKYLGENPVINEKVEDSIQEKDMLISQINELDDGFEVLYARVKEELHNNKGDYEKEILQLQSLIKEVTDYSVKLQAMEQRNRIKFELYFTNKRTEIKQLKMSNQTAVNYYKNMNNQNQNQAYFLDKKK